MKRLFKYFKPMYWELRRILSDIKEVRELILSNRYTYLCLAFAAVDDRYWWGTCVTKYIPEFNPSFLTGKCCPHEHSWWHPNDKISRLEALDKLIAIYEQKIKDF